MIALVLASIMLAAAHAATMVHSGTPPDVPASSDCAIRHIAWQYGRELLPNRGDFKTLFDALQLGACPEGRADAPTTLDSWAPLRRPLPHSSQVRRVAVYCE